MKLFSAIVILFIVQNFSYAQNILSPTYFKNLKVEAISDAQLNSINSQIKSRNASFSDLEKVAIEGGMSANDFSTLKTKLESLSPETKELNTDKGTNIDENPIQLDQKSTDDKAWLKNALFGSEFFSNFNFNVNPNLPAPENYLLGIGDELQLVVYGMQEFSGNFKIQKDGKITVPLVGQIYLNGLSFEAGKSVLKKSLSKVYSSLSSGQSKISCSIINFKSINVTVIGAFKSGNYSVSSFTTVYNLLQQAGGPNLNGSFRNIELIRNNKVYRKIDIYKFLKYGDNSDNINLLENDIVRIPDYQNRVKIEGKVKRPGIFELLPNETFVDLLNYSSGFDESAYKKNIKLVQNTDKELKIIDLTEKDYLTYIPKSGDIFKVATILDRFENKVSIKGSVFRPDDYAFTEGLLLNELILRADGLTEDAYKDRALLIREKQDLTKEIIPIDLNKLLLGSVNIVLQKNDEIIISSIFDLNSKKNVTIGGQIKNGGEYPFVENLSLYDLIIQAGGLIDGSSKLVEISSPIIKDEIIQEFNDLSKLRILEIDTNLLDQAKNVYLNPYDNVQIRKKPIFEFQESVRIEGQIFYPGSYVLSSTNEKVYDVIERSGGLKNEADENSVFVMRKVDRYVTENIENNLTKIPINFKKIKRNKESHYNIKLRPGDKIVVEKQPTTVIINGAVFYPTESPYLGNKNLKAYIDFSGGYKDNADKRKVYVIHPNGVLKTRKNFLLFRIYPKIKNGSEIIVPVKQENNNNNNNNNKLSIVELSIVSGVISSITGMTIAIINLLQ